MSSLFQIGAICMRKRYSSVAGVSLALGLAAIILVLPIPPKRVVYEETSQDKAMLARYSWKPAGLVGWITEDNPWVYLDVYDLRTGKRLQHFSTWGDVRWDAIDRLHGFLPWPAKRTTGNERL